MNGRGGFRCPALSCAGLLTAVKSVNRAFSAKSHKYFIGSGHEELGDLVAGCFIILEEPSVMLDVTFRWVSK